MKKGTVGIVVGLVILAIIVGVVVANNRSNDKSDTTTTPSSSTSATNNDVDNPSPSSETEAVSQSTVSIKDMAFSPSKITVKKGTKVTWTNNDGVAHTVTPDTETSDFKASDTLDGGESYSVTFNTAGTFSYHCSIHSGMTGSVVVTE